MNHSIPTPSRGRRMLVAIAGALAVNAILAGGLLAAAGSSSKGTSPVVVEAQDDCEPATFNAVLGPGACVGDGDTTFDSLIGQLIADQDAPKWRFSREHHKIKQGRGLAVHNSGGEFHTYTEVAEHGGGCVPELNHLLGLSPVAECQPEAAPGVPLAFVTTGVPAGGHLDVTGLGRGVHRFQCLIHPWMRSTITIR